ncbi:protein STAY-GREEN 1, chloroplastic-like [Silene latifolia]|uniref:protein STAY-GREEN 1, chloroplastic-like n=1 Tax=Silene latifolia TaxID=37657 RepID=UPI003D77894A
MATLNASMLLPSNLSFPRFSRSSSSSSKKTNSFSPKMRLFGPAIFEASKLKVLFLGVDEEKHPAKLPRTYTLTHSDVTSKITLAISQTINNSQLQGWYNKLQRDEVVAEWKKVKGKMSLHVHCHISGGHFLLDLFARLRYYIFCKELPVVLKAFVHGDVNLFNQHPELQEASVWVYFHSNIPEFNKVQCWGPLRDAAAPTTFNENPGLEENDEGEEKSTRLEVPCKEACVCCFPPTTSIPWIHSLQTQEVPENASIQGLEQQ